MEPSDPDETLGAVAEAVRRAAPRCGDVRLVLVDGPAGSGKTTFAGRLGERLGAPVLHLDDLLDGWTLAGTLERRLLGEVVAPLREGRDVRTARYDWVNERFDGQVELAWHDVVVIEGCSSGRRSVAEHASYLVWVEAPQDLRLARGLERDGADLAPRWLDWLREEAEHFDREGTRQRADVRLDAWGRIGP